MRCEDVFIIDEETESARRAQLIERIRQHKAIAKMQKVKNVLRKGISSPTEEDLSRISANRDKLINTMKLQRQIEDVRRQRNERREYISYERESYKIEQDAQAEVKTTSLEGRAFVLLPLLSLFRMLLCDNRAKRRLEKLRTRQLLRQPDVSLFASQTQIIFEAVSTTAPQLTSMPASINPRSSTPKRFLMPNFFIPRPLRKPFVFLLKGYQMERLPEFTVDFSSAVTKEYSAYMKGDHNEPSAVTLVDFVQPLVTLETYDLPKKAYGAPFKQSLLRGCDSFRAAAKGTRSFIYRDGQDELCASSSSAAARVGEFSRELLICSGLPRKLSGPLSEDSLSDSENEDSPQFFQADISWLPTCAGKRDDTGGDETLRSLQGAC